MSRYLRKRTFWSVCPRRLKSACTSAQSDQSLRCPHEDTLHPCLSKMWPVKILIRLRECPGWSESSLGVYVRMFVFWSCGSQCYVGSAMRKRVFGHMRTAKAQISLRMRAAWSGPSLFANRLTRYLRMYEWRAKVRMTLCACTGWSESAHFEHDRRHFFSLDVAHVLLTMLCYREHLILLEHSDPECLSQFDPELQVDW